MVSFSLASQEALVLLVRIDKFSSLYIIDINFNGLKTPAESVFLVFFYKYKWLFSKQSYVRVIKDLKTCMLYYWNVADKIKLYLQIHKSAAFSIGNLGKKTLLRKML